MDSAQRAAYDATRDFGAKGFRAGCYAPFTSIYLDPLGDVRACCQNVEHVLGNVARSSLVEIWRGEPAEALRAAMVRYDLGLGCRFCQWQFDDANFEAALARDFDELAVASPEAPWPQRMEFAVSNTCNLECVMCDGDLSSRIRARRERRPPLPTVYDDAFFADLALFLPHLVEARFLGGEPFLARETFRIWDLMVDAGLHTPCKVTTNGTQWNERVERVLDHFPVSVAVSLDGVSARTVESIRVGADHAVLMENLGRFRTYTRARGTLLELTFCLQVANWREFGDYLLLGDEWECPVSVNTVIRAPFSLYHLPLPEFEGLVASLERQGRRLRRRLTLNRPVWDAELDRLRHWRDQSRRDAGATPATGGRRATYFQPAPEPVAPPARRAAPAPAPVGAPARPAEADPEVSTRVEPLPPVLATAAPDGGPSLAEATALATRGLPGARVTFVRCDPDDRVVEVGPDDDFAGLAAGECVGEPYTAVVDLVAARLGPPELVHQEVRDGAVLRRIRFEHPEGRDTFAQAVAFPVPWVEGGRAGSVTVAALSAEAPGWSGPAAGRRP